MTDAALACLVGWPVDRSLSPAIHNAAFRALGLEWNYVTFAVRPGAAAEAVELLRSVDAQGANVTVPHKEAIAPHLDGLAGEAAAAGAVNTVVREGTRFIGHNTDGSGFLAFLRDDAGVDPQDTDVLILGAGGAARGVALALAREGARVLVCARRGEQAEAVASLADGITAVPWSFPGSADLVVNATPATDGLPLESLFPTARVAVDMRYLPPPTALMEAAVAAGARAFDGLGMLVHQAALSFQLWTGRPAPLDVMRRAAEDARAHADA